MKYPTEVLVFKSIMHKNACALFRPHQSSRSPSAAFSRKRSRRKEKGIEYRLNDNKNNIYLQK